MNPFTPPTPPDLKTDLVVTYSAITVPQISSLTFGNGTFVTGGTPILFSTDDGLTWQPSLGGGTASFQNGIFFALNTPFSSRDGRNWQPFGTDIGYWSSLAFGNGVFVASTAKGIAVSSDGETWQTTSNASYGGVVFGNGRFLGIHGAGFKFSSSSDGVLWTDLSVELPPADPDCLTDCPQWQYLDQLIFANGQFITSGTAGKFPGFQAFYNYPARLLTSINGALWTSPASGSLAPYSPFPPPLGSANGQVLYFPAQVASTDLSTWTHFNVPRYPSETITNLESNAPGGQSLQIPVAAAYGNSTYVMGGVIPYPLGTSDRPPIPVLRGSTLGVLERVDHPAATGSRTHILANGRTVIVVNPVPGFPMPLLVSTNSGAAFQPVDLPPDSRGLQAIHYLEGEYIAVGEQGRIVHSKDSQVWKKSSSGTSADLNDVAFGAGTWVAVGTNGVIVTSGDLTNFALVGSGTSAELKSVTFGSAGFVAVGANGTILSSPDGQHWTPQQLPNGDIYGVAFGNSVYVTVGTNGYVQISSNAVDWAVSRPTSGTLRDVCYADGLFFTIENKKFSTGYLSVDGVSWSSTPVPAPPPAPTPRTIRFGSPARASPESSAYTLHKSRFQPQPAATDCSHSRSTRR